MKLQLHSNGKYDKLTTLDLHTEGEPLRIITSGYPDIKGKSILDKRRYVEQELDHLRKVLMFEPRGHADMYGALITSACTPDGDFGILFMHNEGYSSMCGHGIIATITAMVECGEIVLNDEEWVTVKIDSPAGRITGYAHRTEEKLAVSFDCVPSFLEASNVEVYIEGFGSIRCDIAFGGAYYAYVDADLHNIDCSPENVEALISLGRKIKQAVMTQQTIQHPEHDDLSSLYGTIFTSDKTTNVNSHSRHICIFADGEVDRSPTGTGVSGRMALLHAKAEIATKQSLSIESIISSSMTVSAIEELSYFGKKAIIPRVSGTAFITGEHTFFIDPSDAIGKGFLLR